MLNFYGKYRPFLVAILAVIILAFMWGCQRSFIEGKSEDRVVTKVDGYEIFVSDFAYVVGRAIATKDFHLFGTSKAKEKILEDLITRKILIQEAQKQGFDKQKTFMKEIERYWEQALLKFLIKKKSLEFFRDVRVEETEVKEEYNRRKLKIFAEFVGFSDRPAAEELAAANGNFDKVKKRLKERIVFEEPAQWWEYGDLPAHLEDYLFSLGPGDISDVIESENRWIVVRVFETGEVEMPPLEDVSSGIRNDLVKKRGEEMFEKWIAGLKKKTEVKVNYEILEEIDFEELIDIK